MENDEKQMRKNQSVTGGGSPSSGPNGPNSVVVASQANSQSEGGGKIRLNPPPSSKKKFWCYVSSEENFKILKGVAEGLEKKDGQNIQHWNEQVAR